MSRRRATLAALVCILALAGCGSSEEAGLIPESRGQELLDTLDRAETAAAARNCTEAKSLADKGRLQAQSLGRRVDRELRRNLSSGFKHLRERLVEECAKPEETATATPSASPSPTPTPTVEEETPTPEPTPTPAPTEEVPTPTPTEPSGGVEPEVTPGVNE